MEKQLYAEYLGKKSQIKQRLKDFEQFRNASEKEIFAELCFCILTPQAKAIYCDEAIKNLTKTGALLDGSLDQIRKELTKVRFPNNKSGYLINARRIFVNDAKVEIKKFLDRDNIFKTRDWFAKNVKGLGYKESSHFLRNIGLGKDIAILDVHILKNLKRYGVIQELPKTISKKIYLELEKKLHIFSKEVKIPMAELDLLFWSRETGIIFK